MRTVEPSVESVKLFWKEHHVPIVGFCNQADFFDMREILSFGQRDPHSVSGVGAVGNDVFIVETSYTWILHAELFIGCKRPVSLRNQKRLRIRGEAESVVTARQPNNGPPGPKMGAEKHDVFILAPDH